MKREFITTSTFDRRWSELKLTDEDLRNLQNYIMTNPDAGDVIEGTGGAVKIRFSLLNSGKSGGVRVIFADLSHKEKVYLLLCYAKAKQETLTNIQKKYLKGLIRELKGG